MVIRLNPYSNGTLSDKKKQKDYFPNKNVLILILMEHSLTEEGLIDNYNLQGLNPYSNGTLSDIYMNKLSEMSCVES